MTTPSALLDEVEKFYRRFVVMTDAQHAAVALWTLHTHAVDAAEATPYIHTSSPTKKAGKSRLLDVAAQLVRAPLSTGGASEAALFRSIGADTTPTLLWDEVDTIFGPKSPENEGRRGVLNNGYTRNKPYLRCVGEGSKQKVEKFAVFCPKMLCGIGSVPDTIADRSLPIHLKRKTPSEKVERFRERSARLEAAPLREQLTAWADDHIDELAEAHPELPDELDDRAQDVVEPLLAIADAAGGDWPERARKALIELRGQGDVGDEPDAIRLLTDIRTVFTGQEEMQTTHLLYALFDIDTSPWAHWSGETRRGEFGETSIEPNRAAAMKLARTLRPFGIRPVSLGGRVRGYRHVDLEEPFERYLPSPEGASPPSTHPEVVKVVQTQQATQESDISRSSKDGSKD